MENQASSNCIIDPRNFIAEIRAKPELWNRTSRKYKNKTLKENTWMKISKKFNTPVLNCLNLWKNLRDQYVKKRKIIERMPSGSAATRAKEWFLFQSMTFLDVAKGGNKRSISNFDVASIPGIETSDDEKSEFDQTSMEESGPICEKESPKFWPSNRKRKCFQDDRSLFYRSMTTLISYLMKQDDNDDEIGLTFKLMRIKIRRLEKEYPDRVLPLLKDLMDQIDSQFY